MTVDHDVRVCDVGSVSSTSTTAADVQERVAELLRRPVVDDRVDARVEVRQTVPQHADSLQYRPTSLRRNSDACKIPRTVSIDLLLLISQMSPETCRERFGDGSKRLICGWLGVVDAIFHAGRAGRGRHRLRCQPANSRR